MYYWILGTLLFIIVVRFIIKPIVDKYFMQIEDMQNYGNYSCICDDPYKAYRPMMVDVPLIPGTVNNPVCAWHAKSKCEFEPCSNSCFIEKYAQCASTCRFH